MRIDDNKEAFAMMNRALGSLEAKIREAYNKGYQDGLKHMPDTFVADGIRYYRIKDEPQTETYDSEKGKFRKIHSLPDFLLAIQEAEERAKMRETNKVTEPQTCETCKHNQDGWDSESCDPCSRAESNYEPQTGK